MQEKVRKIVNFFKGRNKESRESNENLCKRLHFLKAISEINLSEIFHFFRPNFEVGINLIIIGFIVQLAQKPLQRRCRRHFVALLPCCPVPALPGWGGGEYQRDLCRAGVAPLPPNKQKRPSLCSLVTKFLLPLVSKPPKSPCLYVPLSFPSQKSRRNQKKAFYLKNMRIFFA